LLFVCAALLQQVMQLTPEQIASLPPDQQAQVIALQEHMVRFLSGTLLGDWL
jgi:cleavage stimulation factor subunit 2